MQEQQQKQAPQQQQQQHSRCRRFIWIICVEIIWCIVYGAMLKPPSQCYCYHDDDPIAKCNEDDYQMRDCGLTFTGWKSLLPIIILLLLLSVTKICIAYHAGRFIKAYQGIILRAQQQGGTPRKITMMINITAVATYVLYSSALILLPLALVLNREVNGDGLWQQTAAGSTNKEWFKGDGFVLDRLLIPLPFIPCLITNTLEIVLFIVEAKKNDDASSYTSLDSSSSSLPRL
eukprot:TRINITY_DN6066_c0_g1_i3.p1 TRINITY_DN6066_c0_g1~~TRINITY_DN6066_c0_g1_i3.p1  ORF type:complete len:232 (+),score=55.54 TRINITY_DN6066_c0_g1_i3:315-1010(+)